ncbi:hypothetical protein NX059_008729 [Plenodomus lindquistii]|nr:hypothetical protein NX059_008729 [Plenodomus lindquistii]
MAPPAFSKQQLLALLCLTPTLALAQTSKAATIQSCLEQAGVQASISTSRTWANDTTAFQFRIPREPVAVAFPQDRDEVALALGCARDASVKVSAVGHAHSFQGSGFGNPGNLVINMAAFTNITFDTATNQLTFGGGVNVGPASKYLNDNYGRHFPHVRGAHVGLPGSIFGGGFGTTSRLLGIPSDNLASVEFMLYNGTIVNAGPGSDLLWAAQGAGPSFGIALSATTNTFEIPFDGAVDYTLGLGDVDVDTATAAALAIQKWTLDGLAPDECSLRFPLSNFVSSGLCYVEEASFDEAFAPLVASLEAINITVNLTKTIRPSFWASEVASAGAGMDLATGGTLGGRASLTQSWTTTSDKPFTQEQVKALLQGYADFNRTDMTRTGFMDLWHGVSNGIADSDHAYAHGKELWLTRVDGIGRNGVWPSDGIDYMQGLFAPLETALKKSGPLRSFPNYVNSELAVDDWTSRLYGNNLARLQEIKAAVDPLEVFSGYKLAIPLP